MLSPRFEARGRSWFIWRVGVVGWGLPTAILSTVSLHVFRYGFMFSGPYLVGFVMHLVIFLLGVGIIGGYLWGAIYWSIATRRT
jgi:hypothetical protein